MEAKIKKISELSKLLSVKTRMSDDLFHFLISLALVTCYLACHWRNAWGDIPNTLWIQSAVITKRCPKFS